MSKKLLSALGALALLLAACGGTAATTLAAPDTTEAAHEESTCTVGDAPEGSVTVNVIADESSFQSDLASFEVGVPYHIVVDNVGAKEHELLIMPPMESTVMDMEAMHSVAVALVDEEDLPAGTSACVDVTFSPDDVGQTLEFACHIEGHYEEGMKLAISVTG